MIMERDQRMQFFFLGKTEMQFAAGKNNDLLHLSNKRKSVKF